MVILFFKEVIKKEKKDIVFFTYIKWWSSL